MMPQETTEKRIRISRTSFDEQARPGDERQDVVVDGRINGRRALHLKEQGVQT